MNTSTTNSSLLISTSTNSSGYLSELSELGTIEPFDRQNELKFRIDQATTFLEMRGYSVKQVFGQRISTASNYNENWEPEDEIYVGRVPRDAYEDELYPIFERAGTIYKMRLMMDFSYHIRGYLFIKYLEPGAAERACALLNNYIIRPMCNLSVVPSTDNKCLFFGNIAPDANELKYRLELEDMLDKGNIVNFEFKETSKGSKIAYATFKTHNDANVARRLLIPSKVPICGKVPVIDWIRRKYPRNNYAQRNQSGISTKLFFGNLASDVTKVRLRNELDKMLEGANIADIDLKDFKSSKSAFVTFRDHEAAALAKKLITDSRVRVCGQVPIVGWARNNYD